MNFKIYFALFFLAFNFLSSSVFSQEKVWSKISVNEKFNGLSVSLLEKKNSETLHLNFKEFIDQLNGVPLRNEKEDKIKKIIQLPNENGEVTEFSIFETPIFEASLAAKYPNIKSYIGFSSDKSGAVVRMSVSPKGVQTMISYKDKPTVFMQPLDNSLEDYIVYNRLSKVNLPKEDFICSTANELVETSNLRTNVNQRGADDQILRKFRIAVSVNGEYTVFHGGTVADALAAINATMTRVNAVFETDMAITFVLQDFPELIFTDPATDPYSNSLGSWNVELQNTLTNTIGNEAYDIGHMFGATGGGGNAGCIGCVCRDDTTSTSDQNKGAGITSPSDGIPQGDSFDIDYVAHEIGHQMGANHTFSHNTEGTGVNAEPGSGSTIMGYAGITSSDVQQNSDPYFHYHSIKQIIDNVTDVRTCWQANSPLTLTNNPPQANAGNDYVIPSGTAYVLRGTATDADSGDNLMYCWEQTDSGRVTKSEFGPTRTIGAQARSLPPVNSSDRYIPKISRVLAGQLTQTNPNSGDDWETVSTVARDLNWALTVRDREPSAIGLNGQSSFDTMKITVDDTSGPFVVNAPNSAVTWGTGMSETITWDVANTNVAPVNLQKVNIKLSTDGGLTFPISLASNIDNDGTETIFVPENPTTKARIMVEAVDNIFFAVSITDFVIETTQPTFIFSNVNGTEIICNSVGASATYTFNFDYLNGFTEPVTFSATGNPSGSTVTFNPTVVDTEGTFTMSINNLEDIAVGKYVINVKGTSVSETKDIDVNLEIFSNTYSNINITSPTNGADNVIFTPELKWELNNNATSYIIEIASNNTFSNNILTKEIESNSYVVSPELNPSTVYFWRVKAKNLCTESDYSETFSFTTQNCVECSSSATSNGNTSTTLVQFNTINNITAKTAGYNDYKNIKTEVKRGETHELIVNVNTDGLKRTQTKVWIDWNDNCDFTDTGEEYDLGFAEDKNDAASSLSPLSIIIPNDAIFGEVVMRVSTRNTSPFAITYPTSCENGFVGEVEDYTIIVKDPTASIKDFAFEGFNLFPNPAKGEFTLNLQVETTNKVTVQIFDIRGRLINQKNYTNTKANFSEKIAIENASAGLYLIKVTNGTKQTTRKLILH